MKGVKSTLKVIVYTCNWHPHSSQDAAGRQRLSHPPDVIPIRLTCLGRISPGLILKAFEEGADGVCLLGCPEGQCRVQIGNEGALEVYRETLELLKLLGFHEKRLQYQQIPAGDGNGYIEALDQMLTRIAEGKEGR